MATSNLIKFSGQMNRDLKKGLDSYAAETGVKISTLFNEMAELYLRTKRVRQPVLDAARQVMNEDAPLLRQLAK